MGNFNLRQTGYTDIQTTFRFEIEIQTDANNSVLGLTDTITGYIQSTDLPSATGEPIIWHLPGGMKNHQAGKRTVNPIHVDFVVSTADTASMYRTIEKWQHATYDLNTGTNMGKSVYCTDGIVIKLKAEDDSVQYQFRLLRAQPTSVNFGTLNAEDNSLLRVSCDIIYDNYELKDGNGNLLRNQSN